MAQEFRGEPGPGQKPRAPNGATVALALTALVVLSAAVAAFRWERSRELTSGVPLPPFARLVAESGLEEPPGEGCRAMIELAGSGSDPVDAWRAAMQAGGWRPTGSESGGERAVYRRDGVRLLVAVDAPPGESPRLRLTFRPCPDDLRAAEDPRVVYARR